MKSKIYFAQMLMVILLATGISVQAQTNPKSKSAVKTEPANNQTLPGKTDESETASRQTNSGNPNAGSNNYIQNQDLFPQNADFYIDGTGKANIFDAAAQYNIGGNRVLAVDSQNNNTFTGIEAGLNATGTNNSFFGSKSGISNTNASSNSFFGAFTGVQNRGNNNSFFGWAAGNVNTTGQFNSFFGFSAGKLNLGGSRNSFFGTIAGFSNISGNDNAFFGQRSGFANTHGSFNAFFGSLAGEQNTTGNDNAFFGHVAGNRNITGARNSFYGAAAGFANTLGSDNSFYGAFAGDLTSEGYGNSFFGSNAGDENTIGFGNSFFGQNTGQANQTGFNNTLLGRSADVSVDGLSFATAVGAGSTVSASNTIALGRADGSDKVVVYGLGAAGSTGLCLNGVNQISTCSSSLRYKTNIKSFNSGLNLVRKLRPITFDWKAGKADLGLGAEDVAEIEPLLVTYNKDGEVEGVKYDRIGIVLLNAIKEQQSQIEAQEKQNLELKSQIEQQQKQLEKQRTMIEDLRQLVCSQNPQASVCQSVEKPK